MIMSSNRNYHQRQLYHNNTNINTNSSIRNHHQASTSTSPSTSISISTSTNNNNTSSLSSNTFNDLNNVDIKRHQPLHSSNSFSSLNRRKPAPEFAAPKQPKSTIIKYNYLIPASNKKRPEIDRSNEGTQTLNRHEFNQRRTTTTTTSNLDRISATVTANRIAHHKVTNEQTNEPVYWKPNDNLLSDKPTKSDKNFKGENYIYAPASIAGYPINNYANFLKDNNYNVSSKRSPSALSGRESSIASLFGSMRGKSLRKNWFNSIGRRRYKKSSKGKTTKIDGYLSETPVDLDGHINNDIDIYANCKDGQLKAEHIYAEGLRAIDSNHLSRSKSHNRIDIGSSLNPGETRVIILDEKQTNFLQLVGVLRNWLNDLLASERIIVMDLQEDLYDGQIFVKLFEKLQNVKLDLIEVTQNEKLQKQRLSIVLGQINRLLTLNARWARLKWSVDGIHAKNMPEILHLLIFLAIYYRAPIKLPANVAIRAVEISKLPQPNCQIKYRSQLIELTKTYETSLDDESDNGIPNNNIQQPIKFKSLGADLNNVHASQRVITSDIVTAIGRDAFDELIDNVDVHSVKLNNICQILIKFANRHLNKLNMSCNSMKIDFYSPNKTNNNSKAKPQQAQVIDPNQFSDGLLLVFLIASLENYFVPLGLLFTGNNANNTVTNYNKPENIPTVPSNNIENSITSIQEDSYTNTYPLTKLHNVNFAIQLIEEAGIENVRQLVKPEDIVNGNLKAILRLLYHLFSHYRHL